ncbi:MAG: hypothetical protein Q8M31_11765 [Beijerinckiaceae bacterium]|nr:hypothetical protein [Beijerinckiaceae bacterium]
MSAQIMTLQQYQALALSLRDVQVIETDGLLITRGLLPESGYVLALQPFASTNVTLIHESKSPERLASVAPWMRSSWMLWSWLRRLYQAA